MIHQRFLLPTVKESLLHLELTFAKWNVFIPALLQSRVYPRIMKLILTLTFVFVCLNAQSCSLYSSPSVKPQSRAGELCKRYKYKCLCCLNTEVEKKMDFWFVSQDMFDPRD